MFRNFKLGKKEARIDARTLKFENYADKGVLPAIPPAFNWSTKVKKWGMMKNDVIGDCTIAGAGHLVEAWTMNETGTEAIIPDAQIVAAYSAITGYDPRTGANDNGAVLLDVLRYWKAKGIGNHKIGAYVAVQPKNHAHVEAACYLFGGLYIGVNLPISAQDQKIWDVPSEGTTGNGTPGSWGGHCVDIINYNASGLTVVTWGMLQTMTWRFLDAYCDEIFAICSGDWLSKGKSPNGFTTAQLTADLAAL